jgi:hypothetical protein
MKPNEKIIAEAVRVEQSENTGDVYVVFKITDEQTKKTIRRDWTNNDLEFRLVETYLVQDDD